MFIYLAMTFLWFLILWVCYAIALYQL